MSAASKFQKAKGDSKPASGGRRRASRFSGVNSGGDRDPLLRASKNKQRVRVIKTWEDHVKGKDPYFKVSVEVLESDVHEVGEKVSIIQCTSSAAIDSALPRIKAFVMNAVGCPPRKDAMYATFDPDGDFLELVMASDDIDSYTAPENEIGIEEGTEFGPNPLEGIELEVIVSRGKECGQGEDDYYRNFQWIQS